MGQKEKDEQKADIEKYLLVNDRKLKSFDNQFLNKLFKKHSKWFGDTKEKPDWLSERFVYNDRGHLIHSSIAKMKSKNSKNSTLIKKQSRYSRQSEVVTKMQQVASANKLKKTNWWIILRPSCENKNNEVCVEALPVYKISSNNRELSAEYSLEVILKNKIIRNYIDTSKQKNHN